MSFRYRGTGLSGWLCRAGFIRFVVDRDNDTGFQLMERGRADGSFHLYPIFPFVGERRVQQPMVQPSVICQDQQSFTVEIQPADRIALVGTGKKSFNVALLSWERIAREPGMVCIRCSSDARLAICI